MKKNFLTALKGFFMGAANVVPGVSGGTIALISGIYSDIIDALNAIMTPSTWKALLKGNLKEFWSQIKGTFLLSLGAGIIISIFSLAKAMEFCLSHYPVPTWAFFFGLIIASSFVMLKDLKGWKIKDYIILMIGIALGLVICTLSPTETPSDMWFIFLIGAIAICTMILPGISGSFILVIFGKYEYIMQAVSELNIPVLAVFAFGCVVGILAFAKLLHFLLERRERETMTVLLGFVLGSLVKVWPWSDMGAVEAAQILRTGQNAPVDLQIPGAIIAFAAGIAVIAAIEVLKGLSRR